MAKAKILPPDTVTTIESLYKRGYMTKAIARMTGITESKCNSVINKWIEREKRAKEFDR